MHVHLHEADLPEVNARLRAAIEGLGGDLERAGMERVNDLSLAGLKKLNQLPANLSSTSDVFARHREQFKSWAALSQPFQQHQSSNRHVPSPIGPKELVKSVRERCAKAMATLDAVPAMADGDGPRRVYIPILRGLRPLESQHADLYDRRTRDDYWPKDKPPQVFTGLSMHQELTRLLLGTNRDRKQIARYQDFVSTALFEGRSVTLIPKPDEKILHVKIGNELERPIHQLGDGIQSAIILSFLPFVTDLPTWFFIEEPESHLHPGLQRKILDYFSVCKPHYFFLTTHSNHLLDITIDIREASIFTFRKTVPGNAADDDFEPTFVVENVDSGHQSSLELLGVRNSSVFLVNATVWVEGITDRWYLRKMLRSYMDHLADSEALPMALEEDVHYSFVEYAGANITHWSFLDEAEQPIEVERLCSRALVIVDKDGEKKLTRKENLQAKLGERLIVLPCREIENALDYEVIREVVRSYEGDEAQLREMVPYERYRDKYLGAFIESTVLGGGCRRKGGYKEKSGTLKSKVVFCERALPYIRYESLPESTQSVVRDIYEFIRNQNR